MGWLHGRDHRLTRGEQPGTVTRRRHLAAKLAACCALALLTECGSSPPRILPVTAATTAGGAAPPSLPASPSSRSPDPRPPTPVFAGSIATIDEATRARMTSSWHAGCPVAIADLRLLTLDYWGFDGRAHAGEMVVHRDVARDVVAVFQSLFDERFPIHRMRLVDDYGGNDGRSMAADNTSAFNCRPVTGGSSWSEHAYGRAIDLNPLENPYVTAGGTVLPPGGARFADRSDHAKGMIRPGGVVVEAFASIGWGWGGSWSDPKDYQHFSSTGR
jgi:D-alanyl-D-alanine carboxypeptidase